MTVMAILQNVDKCMRCNGCVTACKREWKLKLPENMAQVQPNIVSPRHRLAIKSLKRGDMGPFTRFSCWHCPDPPCAYECPFNAIHKEPTGAVSVDNAKCMPSLCRTTPGPKPCEIGCQRGGYPKVGVAYESGPYAGQLKMNKCTLCTGRAGADGVVDPGTALPTRATAAEIAAVPERAHEPACVASCPAKAMMWDSKANILAYLQDPVNGFTLANGTQNWIGNGAMYWASKKIMLVPPKADPYVEDHVAPMTSSAITSGSLVLPAIVLGGLAWYSNRRAENEEEVSEVVGGEV